MKDLASQKQPNKDVELDQQVLIKDNDSSPEDKSDIILLSLCAAIMMGILLFLFK